MVLWWASHIGRPPVQQWELSRLVAWCELAFWWASLMVWDAGRGWGHEALWVEWLGCALGWPAPLAVETQRLLGISQELGRTVDVGRNRGWSSHKMQSLLAGPRDEIRLTPLGDRRVI